MYQFECLKEKMKSILFLGHSHIHAIKRGYILLQEHEKNRINASYFHLQQRQYLPYFEDDAQCILHNKLQFDLSSVVSTADVIVSLAFGNEHNVFGLVNHPRPFDFILDSNSPDAIAADAEFVPEAYVENALIERMQTTFGFLRKLREMTPGRTEIYQVQSPPPIPSKNHIFKYPEKYGATLAERGVASKELRIKLWRLYSRLVSNHCDGEGINYLPVPKESQDHEGFLVESCWADDATHGNRNFGELVLKDLIHDTLKLGEAVD